MPLHEFDIIKQYFTHKTDSPYVKLGVGDDAALMQIPRDHLLATSVDTLAENVHFFKEAKPFDVGYKSLAVSLSDIAAMGATPCTVLLALTLEHADANWLSEFSKGFFTLADQHNVALIGGNISRGPLNISTTVNGIVPAPLALTRAGAKPGDKIYVSATLGDASYAFSLIKENKKVEEELLSHFHRPTPRIKLGKALAGMASSAIDISDGLAQDLNRLLNDSHVGATIYCKQLPLSKHLDTLSKESAYQFALAGGEDYELCFTVPAKQEASLLEKAPSLDVKIHCIGEVDASGKLDIIDQHDKPLPQPLAGWQHF